jgi:MFS transporter
MAHHLKGLLLFPEAFAALVLSKTYLITKSALVPSAVDREEDLVDANSRLAVLGVVAGFAIAAPGAVLLKVSFLGGDWVLRLAALVFALATVAAFRLHRAAADAPRPVADERQQLRAAGILLAASAMGVLRGIVGFLTFLVTFGFRQSAGVPAFWFGVVLVSSLLGTFVGNLLAPRVRRLVPEERMLMGALLVVAFVGLVAARFGTRPAVAALAGTVGVAAAAAKVAFDSIVQRDAPDAARGQTFARFETRFQLLWVLGAAVPVVITPLSRHIDLGMVVLAFAAAFAAFSYAVGRKAVAHRVAEQPVAERPAAEPT